MRNYVAGNIVLGAVVFLAVSCASSRYECVHEEKLVGPYRVRYLAAKEWECNVPLHLEITKKGKVVLRSCTVSVQAPERIERGNITLTNSVMNGIYVFYENDAPDLIHAVFDPQTGFLYPTYGVLGPEHGITGQKLLQRAVGAATGTVYTLSY